MIYVCKLHWNLKDYQARILEYEKRLKQEYLDELRCIKSFAPKPTQLNPSFALREINQELTLRTHREQKRKSRQLKKAAKKTDHLEKYAALVAQRNKEAAQTMFFYVNMQKWAGNGKL
jgi:hypothetical protein